MRDTTQLHPELQELMNKHIKECEKAGLKIKITECLRTVAEQDALYAQGRTKPGKIVTNARGNTYSSFHMWGLAYDTIRNDGKPAYDNTDGFFDKVGKIGQKLGLTWGGSWRSIVDKPHFQLDKFGSTTTILKQKYGTPEKFKATWPKPQPKKETNDEKYGKKLEEKKYVMTSPAYLRTSPAVGKNKVKYKDLSDSLKKKCSKDAEKNAKMKEGSIYTRIRSYTDENDNKWHQMKSGFWIGVRYNDSKKIRSCD